MRKFVKQMTVVLILAFALGAIVGISSPTEVLAADCECGGIHQCYKWYPPGTQGCGVGQQRWEIWSMTKITPCNTCCGTLVDTGCSGA